MAGFEGTRIAPVGQALREWRLGRFAPLYVAGVVAGVGIGLGISTWPSAAETQDHVAPSVLAPSIVDSAPVVFAPDVPAIGSNPSLEALELPTELAIALGREVAVPALIPAAPVVVEEAAPAPEAVAPQAPAKPAAVAPANPAPPAPAAAEAPAASAPAAKPNFYMPAVSAGPATALELNLFGLINQERANAGLAPYVLDAGLTKVARTRSQQLIDQNYFAHRDPYGYSMYVELLAYFGYTSYAWAGENLAMNNWPAETTANEAIRGLMGSPTHRANLLAGDFFRIGIGEVTAADGRHFFTMIFLG